MRLLQYNGAERISFIDYLPKDKIPAYAILSHTWGLDSDEVKFADVMSGAAASKSGYEKILFCMRQAKNHGLQYFWVDTCCIDKTNSVELSEAINSMFRWYANAAKCYVYLSDVSRSEIESSGQEFRNQWEHALSQSRWFRRGWTLQELLASGIVEFFSKEGERLGSKSSLERQISAVTRIPVSALRGSPLATFTVQERFSWQENRDTTKEEDRYYSLLGIMNVSMPLIYGEGESSARRRLEKELSDATKGTHAKDFSVTFNSTEVAEVSHFVARVDELRDMRMYLTSNGTRRYVVLHGLGGIGKTQLSIAYALRYQDDYSAVFWLNIKDDDAVKSSFVKVAKQILRDHPSADRLSSVHLQGDIDAVVEAVKAWLSLPGNTRWLLIFDNYDRPRLPSKLDSGGVDIRTYLPEAHQGFVIVTTRSSEISLGQQLPIQKLANIQDGLSILESSSQRHNLMQDPDAERLARKLDGLPLALATAGAYLQQSPADSCGDYLEYYTDSWAQLQETSPRLMSYEDRTLYTTWQISFDMVERQNTAAANILRLWAYFGNQDIWFELLHHATTMDGATWLKEVVASKVAFNRHVGMLFNHGLVEHKAALGIGPEVHSYSIHSCLHSWTQTVLNATWDRELFVVALHCIASHVPSSSSQEWWTTSRRLLSHATECARVLEKDWLADNGFDWAVHNLGDLYNDQGKLEEAEQMYERALRGKEKALGLDHTSTLDTVNNLGNLYKNQGKLNEAEQMYERALRGREKTLGLDHTSTLQTVNNLGNLYAGQGKLNEAEQMYEQALRGYEKALGPDHTSTLQIVNNLGALYADQGKLDVAEQMYERALRGYEQALGLDALTSPLLNTVNNLGNLYAHQGKLNEAEQMYERALRGKEKALGLDHTSTLQIVNNLGLLYYNQGKLDEAEQMYERALRGNEKALGLDHTSTLQIVTNLGILYANREKIDKAEQMYERALRGNEKALGPDHTSTLQTVNNLGNLYKNQGKLDEAEQMYERALRGYEKALGLDHTSTLDVINNLGVLYADQGKLEEAEQMYERALRGKERALGLDHTSTMQTVNNLGIVYKNQGKLDEAEQMYERALRGKEKTLGPDHTSTLQTVNNLGILYTNQGRLDEAEQMHERALRGTETALGPDHTSTLNTIDNLGILYKNQGKLDKAEQMYERALRGKEKALGPDHIWTLQTVHNLGALYADQGKLDVAEQMYERALRRKENALGLDHTSTLRTVNNLGLLYYNQGKLDEAEQMYERALRGYEKALRLDHTLTLDTVNNLGILYADQGKLEEAEQMYERALRGKERALGQNHTSTLQTVNNLGNLYKSQGKLDEAEQMYERALRGHEQALGLDALTGPLLSIVNNLGALYADQGKVDEAEQMYKRALRGCEKVLGPDHNSTLDIVNNLGELYANQGKLNEAEQMYERALQGYQSLPYRSQARIDSLQAQLSPVRDKMHGHISQLQPDSRAPSHSITGTSQPPSRVTSRDRGKHQAWHKVTQGLSRLSRKKEK